MHICVHINAPYKDSHVFLVFAYRIQYSTVESRFQFSGRAQTGKNILIKLTLENSASVLFAMMPTSTTLIAPKQPERSLAGPVHARWSILPNADNVSFSVSWNRAVFFASSSARIHHHITLNLACERTQESDATVDNSFQCGRTIKRVNAVCFGGVSAMYASRIRIL